MIIMIEYCEGDTVLYGKNVSVHELRAQLRTIESLYDRKTDNFVPLLCRMYSWEVLLTDSTCTYDYIYDRDTGLILRKVSDPDES